VRQVLADRDASVKFFFLPVIARLGNYLSLRSLDVSLALEVVPIDVAVAVVVLAVSAATRFFLEVRVAVVIVVQTVAARAAHAVVPAIVIRSAIG
jgi:hypothetical protein